MVLWYNLSMVFDLGFLPEADDDMNRIEADPSLTHVVEAVNLTLGRIELDPGDRRLRTRQFQTSGLHDKRMTQVGVGEWHVFWQTTDEPTELVILRVVETPAP